jgi:hypothetical protein
MNRKKLEGGQVHSLPPRLTVSQRDEIILEKLNNNTFLQPSEAEELFPRLFSKETLAEIEKKSGSKFCNLNTSFFFFFSPSQA